MITVFLDTNVLIDFFADRKPFSIEAARLFNYSFNKELKIYVSAVSYNNLYYILRQSCSHSETIKMLSELNEWADIIDVSKDIIKKSLKSDFKDFEDAIQYNCAKSLSKIDFIVTRDTKDFKSSTLPILNPKEAVSMVESSM
ncbi:MAG: PIN domain-containing protein [Bacteroidia bacterium]|jgi:predicted nucleic acid-binding protein|nr:PIN domain-containing protein [Bacteroidia bacterium]